ncbi:MAG TPA: hypothetical protein VFG72_06285 [Marmoricola sp.]|nr:hypothetical protein [Marmoricola sp.]
MAALARTSGAELLRRRTLVAGSMTTAALVLAGLPAAPPAAASVTVRTDDGVALQLSPTGKVTSLRLGGKEVAGGTRSPLFSVRKVGGTPNLLPNPGLEVDRDGDGIPDGWRLMSGVVEPEWVTDQAHRGQRSVRFQAPTVATSTSLQTTVAVEPSRFYRLDGWMRSEDVQPTAATAEPATGPSPVRLKVQQLAGSTVVGSVQAYGYTDTAGWHRGNVGFRTRPEVTSVRVVAQVVAGSGTVWYDDLSLRELFRPGWGAARGTVKRTASGAKFRGTADKMDIAATVTERSDHVRIDGTVRSSTRRETPFQLRVTLPVDAVGWRWWDDPRHFRVIRPGKRYDYLTEWNEQQTSRYPFNTLSSRSRALTVGLPLDRPKLARVEYGGGRLHLTFDLGVAAGSSSRATRAPFSLVLFTSAPGAGYRGATAEYYDIFPRHFQRRTVASREGGWFGSVSRSRLADTWDDFGLGLNMIALGTGNDGGNGNWGAEFLPWDNERGIYATAYNHHWGYKHPNVDDPTIPTYETEMDRIRADSHITPTDAGEHRLRDRSVATLDSGARDINDRYLYARYKGFLQHYENLNPLDGALDWRTVSRIYQMDAAVNEAERLDGTLDALHLDSVSGMRRWGSADDYHKDHWANTRYGLTFSYDSGRVVDRLAFGVAAQVAYVSKYAHDRGMFLSANFNGSDARSASWFGAHAIDYVGLERGLPEKASDENDPHTTVDGFALFKRVLAGQRPVSTIDPDCDTYDGQEVEKRFHQTMLYGIYMGCGGGATWTDEQRVVFAKYTPLLREINEAGWEVVTAAESSDPAVLVERFGSMAEDGAVWFAVHNPTEVRRPYVATVNRHTVEGLSAAALSAEDRMTGEPVVVGPSPGGVSFGGDLAPFTTALVRITPGR